MFSTPQALLLAAVFCLIGALIGWLARGNRDASADLNDLVRSLEKSTNAEVLDQTVGTRIDNSLQPVQQALTQLDGRMHALDVERAKTYASLTSQVQSITRTSALLSDRTNKLVTALSSPQTRGRWGEIQLERVVELAGMQAHCDFDVQVSTKVDGHTIRPDMVINLSGGRRIVVDAKAPFTAYLDALDTADPEEHEAFLRRHAYHLRQHVVQLSSKSYTAAFSRTPEFVILFVPADPFLDAALRNDPELLEDAFARNIVLATPSTLMVLLRTVALGWQQEAVGEQAAEIKRLGQQLHSRLGTMAEHYNRVGASLDKAVEAYNATLSSIDSRVLVTARKLSDLNVITSRSTEATLKPVTTRAREATDPTMEGEVGDP